MKTVNAFISVVMEHLFGGNFCQMNTHFKTYFEFIRKQFPIERCEKAALYLCPTLVTIDLENCMAK